MLASGGHAMKKKGEWVTETVSKRVRVTRWRNVGEVTFPPLDPKARRAYEREKRRVEGNACREAWDRRVGTPEFEVRGLPVAQGSVRAFVVRGRARVVSVTKELKAWRETIADVARNWYGDAPLEEGPVELTVIFHLPRPARPKGDGRLPIAYPDVDKLARGVLDALTGVVYVDDAQVTDLKVLKRFGRPGALIVPRSLPPAVEL